MKSFKDILLEKLKVSANTPTIDEDYIDSLKAGSKEKAEAVLEFMKEKYGDLFDDYRILYTNNVTLGKIKKIGSGTYDGSSFTVYLTDPYEYIIRRIMPSWSSPRPAKFVQGFETFEETINKFDSLLKKRGYLK